MNKLKQIVLMLFMALFLTACATPDHVYPHEDLGDTPQIDSMIKAQDAAAGVGNGPEDIVVTPAYDEYGRVGAKVTPSRGEPYYVDPYYEDPMPTNRHSDEPTTNSNWRVLGW